VRPACDPTGGLSAARPVLHEFDLELWSATSELDLIAAIQRGVLDSLAVEPSAIAASGIDQKITTVLVPDLRVATRRIEVDLRVEVDVAVRHSTDANQVLLELELTTVVSALDLT